MQALVADDLTRVNAIIVEKMHSPVALIPQLAGHIVAAGGKRLRPMLTLASARLCEAREGREYALAACVEFIHTATLLHDDVVDESHLRRGLETANAVWGNKASVLVGDFLFSRAFQLMVVDGSLTVLKVLSDASATIAEGEVHQLMTANDTATDERAYLQVIEAKTAALFAAACEIGAVVAHRTESEQAALRSFGLNFGNAFQLVDDILDYSAEQQALGKSIGDDFRDGKVTLPLVLAFARGDAEEQAFWRRCIEAQELREGDLEQAIALMERHGALEESKLRARGYAERARRDLAPFPDNAAKQALLQAIDFCLDRLY
ncbi:farnesyltranstransferase [Phormidium willei BDU 130791]|nr:farnesyltranstransferase [Phormidium willei BDU 130791]